MHSGEGGDSNASLKEAVEDVIIRPVRPPYLKTQVPGQCGSPYISSTASLKLVSPTPYIVRYLAGRPNSFFFFSFSCTPGFSLFFIGFCLFFSPGFF